MAFPLSFSLMFSCLFPCTFLVGFKKPSNFGASFIFFENPVNEFHDRVVPSKEHISEVFYS